MCAHKSFHALIISLFIILFSLSVMPDDAFAQNQTIEEAFNLSKSAMEDYDFLELESADSKLMQAAQIVESLGLTDPNIANIYIAQGVVSYGRFKDSAIAIADERTFSAFLKALTFKADAEIPGDYKSAELEAILDRARETLANTPKATVAAMAGIKPSIEHTAVTTSQRCADIKFEANISAHPDIYAVKLYYSIDDSNSYESLDMIPDTEGADRISATLSGINAQGSRIRYYIEAVNSDGTVVASAANAVRPINTMLYGECSGFSDEEIARQYGTPLFQWSVLIGTAGAFIGGKLGSLESKTYTRDMSNANTITVGYGMAVAPLHLRTAIMFNLPADFQIGAYLRGQVINIVGKSNNSNEDGEIVGNIMAGVVARYFPIARQPYRLYVGLELGWGGANATVPTDNHKFNAIYLLKGPVHIAPEVGFLWSFHKYVGLDIHLAIPIHFPDKVNFQIDFSIGPYVQF